MSRIGNKHITLAEGVSVEVGENNFVVVKGPKGQLDFEYRADAVDVKIEDGKVFAIYDAGVKKYIWTATNSD